MRKSLRRSGTTTMAAVACRLGFFEVMRHQSERPSTAARIVRYMIVVNIATS
jgi:hypothetical protein